MDKKKIINFTNTLGVIAVLALLYWIIIWGINEIFSLRVFRETITDILGYSILGILALLAGVFVINIMFNLSLIAENTGKKTAVTKTKDRLPVWLIAFLVFLLLSILIMFLGDYGSTRQREIDLRNSAQELLQKHSATVKNLSNYKFTTEWLKEVNDALTLIEKLDPNISNIRILFPDNISGQSVYLAFRYYYSKQSETNPTIQKIDYIATLSQVEREYLDKVFNKNHTEKYFRANKGKYLLYIPHENNGRKVVFIFNNYQGYGTYGKTVFNSADGWL